MQNQSCLVDDEIILCLNYDGLYGINNINRYLQLQNDNIPVDWRIWTYKKDDPVIFNESRRFPCLFNNLKGKILDIHKEEEGYKITFRIEVDTALTALDIKRSELKLIDSSNNKSVIELSVYDQPVPFDSDNDEMLAKLRTITPFQIAYAVSIHKSQGLEYDSVKLIITNDVYEKITHNIFYTAITRCKENLKIFWSPETQDAIIKGFKPLGNPIDKDILLKKIVAN